MSTKKIKKVRRRSKPATAQTIAEIELRTESAKKEKKLSDDELNTLVEIVAALNHTSTQVSQLVYDDMNENWNRGLAKHIILNIALCNTTIQRILGVKSGLSKE